MRPALKPSCSKSSRGRLVLADLDSEGLTTHRSGVWARVIREQSPKRASYRKIKSGPVHSIPNRWIAIGGLVLLCVSAEETCKL
jgi:hypothetical protein